MAMMTQAERRRSDALWLFEHPAEFARRLGYPDFRDNLHGVWMDDILRFPAEDMTLQAHRGSYKTTALELCIAIMLAKYNDKNIIFLRKTDTDVAEVLKTVARIIQHPLFMGATAAICGTPLTIERMNTTELTTNAYSAPRGAAQLLGIGIGGSITGKHADIVITDDIVNVKDRMSRAERERTKAAYMELQNIRNRGGRIINTGTPWHVDDAFTIMPKPMRYDCYQTGLISAEKLEDLRHSMSASLFSANYELRHIAAENALFPEPPQWTDDESLLRDGICHIDAAYGGEDWTAFTCMARVGNTLYAYGRMWHGHIDTCRAAAVSEAQRLMCAPVYCEDNGDKGYNAKEIRKLGMPCREYHEGMNKYLKISTYLKKWWTNIVWLRGTDAEYIAQIQNYTEDAEHDDAPDSAACCCRILDRERRESLI